MKNTNGHEMLGKPGRIHPGLMVVLRAAMVGGRLCCAIWLTAGAIWAQSPARSKSLQPRPSRGGEQIGLADLNQREFGLEDTPEQLQPLLVQLILESVPHDYEDAKKWGRTKEVASGLNIKVDGWNVRTKRRRKEVNQGTWKRYHVTLVDPHEFFELQMLNLREESPGVVLFELLVRARMRAYGRLQEWQRGVRLFSISAEATADVALTLDCRLTSKLDASHLPPDFLLQPTVVAADVRLKEFELHRVSKADGPIVREFGDSIEKLIRKKLAEKNNKLVNKINRQIEKYEDRLRFSFRDMAATGMLKNEDTPGGPT